MGQFWFISGPPSQPLWAPGRPIFAKFGHFRAPSRPILVKFGTLTWPILVDTGVQKRSMLVTLEAVGGPILVHFGPPSQPPWATVQSVFANFGHLWGARTPDFGQTLNANLAHLG